MAIDFPDSPTVDQQYSVGDRTWTWNGSYWQLSQTSSTFTASDTAPVNPSAGDIWFESDTGKTFVYYDQAWVEIGAATDLSDMLSDADADTFIQVEASTDEDKIRFNTAGSERVIVDASGNVGIGISSPVSTLDIHGASFAEINLNDSDGTVGASTSSKVQFQAGGVDAGHVGFNTASGIMTLSQENGPLWINNKSANNIVFRTSDNTQMTLDSSGNLGIGTPTPSYELHVAAYNPTLLLEATASDSNMPAIRFEGTKVTTGTASEVALNSRNTGSFTINIDPNDSDADSASYFSVDIDGSETLRIDSEGNVGIGKQSPSELLDIDAGTSGSVSLTTSGGRTIKMTANDSDPFLSVGSTTAHSAAIMTNGVRRIIVLDDGKVGIGRTSPSYLLDVNGDAQIASSGASNLLVKTTNNSSYTASITIGGARTGSTDDNLSQLKFYNFSNQSSGGDYEAARISAVDPSGDYANGRGALLFQTSNGGTLSEQMFIDQNGRVGIGTTAPDDLLEVQGGNIRTTGYVRAGEGNGGVALTHNDGQGNANLTFNHVAGVPEQNGNSARIAVNTDSSTDANMSFELKTGVTNGVSVNTSQIMRVDTAGIDVVGNITYTGSISGGSSDERLKTISGTVPNALEKLAGIRGYYYTLNETAESLGLPQIGESQVGVLAQEVMAVMPELVTIAPISERDEVEEEYYTVRYERFAPLLIEAIHEQQAIIETLTARIEALEAN